MQGKILIMIKPSQKKELDSLKIIPNEPYYRVLDRILDQIAELEKDEQKVTYNEDYTQA